MYIKRIQELVFLAVFVFLVGCKGDKNHSANQSADLSEAISTSLQEGDFYISSEELADLIINEDPSLKLIDVRNKEDYDRFSLPGAIHFPIDETDNVDIEKLDCEHQQVIVYSNAGLLAEKVWYILRWKGCPNILVLEHGLNGWVESILDPKMPDENASQDIFDLYNFRIAARNYFAGLSRELDPEPYKEKAAPKKTVVVKPKKKVAEEEEGC